MKNHWTKRNPYMSMWLSAANTVANSARGRLAAESRRQAAALISQSFAQAAEFWAKVLAPPKVAPKRRKRRTR